MKRSIILCLLMTCITLAFAYDVKVSGIYYNLNKENKTATITYRKLDPKNIERIEYSGNIEIPKVITVKKEKYTVNCVGDSAFFGCHDIDFLILPPTITTIGKSAFEECSYAIDDNGDIFYKTIFGHFPDSLLYIGDRAFANSALSKNIHLPKKLTTIGSEAFMGSKIEAIYIPNTLQHVGYAAFENCNQLMGVSIKSLESWCNIDFETIYSNPLASAHNLFIDATQIITELKIPDGVTNILPNSFAGANFLSIRIPTSVKSIGNYAFYLCLSIQELFIPSSVDIIYEGAFKNCNNLKKIYISNPKINIEENNFENLYANVVISEDVSEQNLSAKTSQNNKCLPPVISYVDGQLNIECPTPGSVCQYIIQKEDIDPSGNKGELIIHVIAMAEGYENSEVVEVNLLELMAK